MTIPAGSRLGSYEILSPLGAGGMGEVYRARDPKLQREVAVKVLSASLARDSESLARFEREARLLAAVDHPNIAVIHAIESEGERPFLVMELIPGETLAERLAAGPLPLAEALALAARIADALSSAHERGVVHRDLKPGNIRLTPEGRVKVLDFGLARIVSGPSGTDSVTVEADATAAGTILGTPAYMSPEQARGRPVDRRTDLWSFGCVLFEMLSGRKAFPGDTPSDAMAAVLTREPDWGALPPATPTAVRDLLRRCLEKDPNRRMRDAGDVRLELEPAASSVEAGPDRATRRSAGGLAGLLKPIFSVFARGPDRTETTSPRPAPKLSQWTVAEGIEGFPAWSRDGSRLAFAREVGSVRRIFLKDLATGAETAVTPGSCDEIQPEWTPDGILVFVRGREPSRRLEPRDLFGQYDGADVWALDPAAGRETRLVESAANPSVSPDGRRIAVDASWAGPRRIWMVDPKGRNPEQATTDASEAVAHVRPRWSPDGRKIVFQSIERTKFDVRVVDVQSRNHVWVTNDHFQDIGPTWSPSGRFLYFSSYRSGGLNVWRVAVAPDGTASGLLEQLTTGPGQDVDVAISPDGRRLAFSILKQNASLWRLPVDPETGRPGGSPEKLVASTREDSRGAWSSDGRRIAFNSDRGGQMNIWLFDPSSGAARQLTRGPGGDFQPRFSPDGRSLAFFSSRSGSPSIWVLDVESGSSKRLTREPSVDVNPFFSPDGAKIAYMSDQGGRLEVWLMDADGGHPRPLTETGVMGHFLAWTRDGRAILYRNPSGKPATFRVPVDGGEPEAVAEVVGGAHMSLSPDGTRIMDVLAHRSVWVSPLSGGSPEKVFEFDDPDVRIDYPLWSPDGRYLLFDRFRPQGGNIWLMEGFE
jgi:Tol biopolymer transport system component/tRNA A-37 threonylcarbamoyl transferase component Bud32